ncbi:hypothetical protein E5288_WYG016680 [Bos mutus]|uniref:Uncharacterized protein n=1 Tax=Bos mutus TaxID=72004 RepID=A0A6B0R788_9CETA|nr:hypothetical protein [Bos mutus]
MEIDLARRRLSRRCGSPVVWLLAPDALSWCRCCSHRVSVKSEFLAKGPCILIGEVMKSKVTGSNFPKLAFIRASPGDYKGRRTRVFKVTLSAEDEGDGASTLGKWRLGPIQLLQGTALNGKVLEPFIQYRSATHPTWPVFATKHKCVSFQGLGELLSKRRCVVEDADMQRSNSTQIHTPRRLPASEDQPSFQLDPLDVELAAGAALLEGSSPILGRGASPSPLPQTCPAGDTPELDLSFLAARVLLPRLLHLRSTSVHLLSSWPSSLRSRSAQATPYTLYHRQGPRS